MASSITRFAWTDDSGTPSAPVGNGTKINNAQLQLVFDAIDAMFTAGTFNVGGVFTAEGFGNHTFSASGTGGNQLAVRNAAAGTGNYAGLLVGNNGTTSALALWAFSTTYTSTGLYVADGCVLESTRAGGLGIAATNASGVLRFHAGGATERMRLDASGRLGLGTTSPAAGGLTVAAGAIATTAAIGAFTPTHLVLGGGGSSPQSGMIAWGDGTGYHVDFGTRSGGNFSSRFRMLDTGQMLFSDGSAGAPSISFINDLDTGLWWSAPASVPKLSASVSGNEILRIESENALHKPTVRIVGGHSTDHCAKLVVERKASATTAPGVLALQAANGTTYFVYAHTDGTLRMGTTEPTPTNGEGVGGKVGTQT